MYVPFRCTSHKYLEFDKGEVIVIEKLINHAVVQFYEQRLNTERQTLILSSKFNISFVTY